MARTIQTTQFITHILNGEFGGHTARLAVQALAWQAKGQLSKALADEHKKAVERAKELAANATIAARGGVPDRGRMNSFDDHSKQPLPDMVEEVDFSSIRAQFFTTVRQLELAIYQLPIAPLRAGQEFQYTPSVDQNALSRMATLGDIARDYAAFSGQAKGTRAVADLTSGRSQEELASDHELQAALVHASAAVANSVEQERAEAGLATLLSLISHVPNPADYTPDNVVWPGELAETSIHRELGFDYEDHVDDAIKLATQLRIDVVKVVLSAMHREWVNVREHNRKAALALAAGEQMISKAGNSYKPFARVLDESVECIARAYDAEVVQVALADIDRRRGKLTQWMGDSISTAPAEPEDTGTPEEALADLLEAGTAEYTVDQFCDVLEANSPTPEVTTKPKRSRSRSGKTAE